MSWTYLIIAGIFEIVWAITLKMSDGFSNMLYSCITVITMAASIVFLSLALKTIPIGNAYAIWTGIGAVGVAIFGMVFFNESADIKRLICISLIVIGIIGLKMVSVDTNTA